MALLNVVVAGIGGPLWEGSCAATMTVSELKRLIEVDTNIPALQQRLLHGMEILDPTAELQELQHDLNVYQFTLVRRTEEEVEWLARFQKKGFVVFGDAPYFIRNDFEIVTAAVRNSAENLRYAGEEIVAHRGFLRLATYCFQMESGSLYHSPEAAKSRRDVVLAAVRAKGGAEFAYASEELRNDPDITLAAVELHAAAFYFAGEVPKGSRAVVMSAVGQKGSLLKDASNELKGDRDVVLRAIHQDACAFQDASEELKGDREFVMRVVQHKGWVLKYAGDRVKADREVVMQAIQQDASAFEDASEELRADREFVMRVVQQKGWLLKYASDQVKNDRDVVRLAVQQDATALRHASEELRADRDFMTLVVRRRNAAVP